MENLFFILKLVAILYCSIVAIVAMLMIGGTFLTRYLVEAKHGKGSYKEMVKAIARSGLKSREVLDRDKDRVFQEMGASEEERSNIFRLTEDNIDEMFDSIDERTYLIVNTISNLMMAIKWPSCLYTIIEYTKCSIYMMVDILKSKSEE